MAAAQEPVPVKPAPYTSGLQNYVRTWNQHMPQKNTANISSTSVIPASDMTTVYHDGLGRPVQTVIKQGAFSTGNTATDLVTATVYDEHGRIPRQYLPFAANVSNGLFKLNPFDQQLVFYNGVTSPVAGQGETHFYAKTDYEPSPDNRIVTSYPAGNSWVKAGRGDRTSYKVNTVSDLVKIFLVTDVANAYGTYTVTGNYATGELSKIITSDEHGKQTIEFHNKEGLLILRKVQLTAATDIGAGSGYTGWLCTYYIYGKYNDLRAVVQPRGVELLNNSGWVFNSTILLQFCFQYEYDSYRRNIRKHIPGATEILMVYDVRNRLVLSQDGKQRAAGKWLVNRYDVLDRLVSTWQWNNATAFTTHLTSAESSADYPTATQLAGAMLLSETYYDNYSWVPSGIGLSNTYLSTEAGTGFIPTSDVAFPYPRSMAASSLTKGLVTGTKTLVLNSSGYLYTVNFYDEKSRPIQVLSSNITGGVDKLTTQYSFNGKVLVTKLSHVSTGKMPGQVTTITRNEYDAAWRIVNIFKKIDAAAEKKIATYEYDALGKLRKKHLSPNYNGTVPLDSISYRYNIRGWLTAINQPYANSLHNNNWFGEELVYDKTFSAPGGATNFNGNISALLWRSKNDGERRAYAYNYDAAGRLLKAQFTQYTGGWNNSAGKDYTTLMGDGILPATAYDANGNILKMTHFTAPATKIDELTYNYDQGGFGNKLWRVTDAVNNPSSSSGDFKEITSGQVQDYVYDLNGNLITDLNKNLSVTRYNYLNLPDSITIFGKGYIEYTYDARGNKLRKKVTDVSNGLNAVITVTDYISGFEYIKDTLVQFAHEEGRIRRTNTGAYIYDYFLRDHLGSVRVALTEQTNITPYYTATMEPDRSPMENSLFYNIDNTRTKRPLAYPPGDTSNRYVAKLDGDKNITGPSLILKVNTGDTIQIAVNSWYTLPVKKPASSRILPPEQLAIALENGTINAGKLLREVATTGPLLIPAVLSLLNTRNTDEPSVNLKPRAYLNWVLVDEELKPVHDTVFSMNEYSGYQQVGLPDELKQHLKEKWVIPQSGFVYIFTSNETPEQVYFDNLIVKILPGPLLEVNHTYPFGLTIAGISAKGQGKLQNKYNFNGKELQQGEIKDGSGLDWYDYGARMYDPQLGKWMAQDAAAGLMKQYSPYIYSFNNPIRFIDLDGLLPQEPDPRDLYKNSVKIDMRKAPPYSNLTAAGIQRNGQWFWKEMLDKYPKMFDNSNQIRIKRGLSPEVNAKWIEFNPNHVAYKGDKLIHHHIDQGEMAAGIPQRAHRENFKDLHHNRGGRSSSKLDGKLGLFAMIFDLSSALNGNPHSLWNQIGGVSQSDIGKVKYDEGNDSYYTVNSMENTYENGEIVNTKFEYTVFSDYRWDDLKKQYIGINPIGTFIRYFHNRRENNWYFPTPIL